MSTTRHDDFYITLSSDGSTSFQDNQPANFRIQLDKPVLLGSGNWKVGLSAIQYPQAINNIDNETFIRYWNGAELKTLYFPATYVKDISSFIAYLNMMVKQVKFKSTLTLLSERFQSTPSDEMRREIMQSTNIIIPTAAGHSAQFPSNDHSEERVINIKPKDSTLSTVNYTDYTTQRPMIHISDDETDQFLLKPFNLTTISDAPTLFPLPNIDSYTEGELRLINEELEVTNLSDNLKTLNTITSSRDIFKKLLSDESLPKEALLEPPQYEGLFSCSWNETSNNLHFAFQSPDVDIGFSPALMNILGFKAHNSVDLLEFEKRRFFHTYLKYIAGNGTFLQGKEFQIFRHMLLSEDEQLMEDTLSLKEKEPQQDENPYWLFIIRILTHLFKINPITVWNDFNAYLTNSDSTVIATNNSWPLHSPWRLYFNNDNFTKLVSVICGKSTDGNIFPTNHFNSDKLIFRQRGAVISYYMLQALCNEYPSNNMTSTILPSLSYANSTFFIYTDIIEPDYFNESKARLLGIIQTTKTHNDEKNLSFIRQTLNPVQYKPCAAGLNTLATIHVYILSLSGIIIPFQRGPVFIELHFIRERST